MTISPSSDAALGQVREQRLDELGEVASERPLVPAAELDLGAVPKDDAAKAVPLRLVDETVALGHLAGELRQHR